MEAARAEQDAGINPLGLIFPSPKFKLCRSSNFNRNVLQRGYAVAGWRDSTGNGRWTWHSLRHVFCTTALFTWKLEATDVSCMAGHANVRTTLLMYVGTTARRPGPRPRSNRLTRTQQQREEEPGTAWLSVSPCGCVGDLGSLVIL